MKKAQLIQSWITAKATQGVQYETTSWTAEQNKELEGLKQEEIELDKTEVGRQADKIVTEALTILPHLSESQVQQIRKALPGSAQEDTLVERGEDALVERNTTEIQEGALVERNGTDTQEGALAVQVSGEVGHDDAVAKFEETMI